MINEEKTLEQFGYTSDSLSHGSHKRVVAICNNCGKERIVEYRISKGICRFCSQKGKVISEETKKKLSELNLGKNNPMYGKKLSEKIKRKMSISKMGQNNPNYGKKLSNEHKEKISISNTGKYRSYEMRQKISTSKLGNKNPNWNGGISLGKYCSKFNNECRENNRNKFHNKCFLCGKTKIENGRKLSVHHVDYNKNQGCNDDWKLVPLCSGCHSKTSGKYLRDYYEELISRLLYIRKLIFEYNNKIDYRSI